MEHEGFSSQTQISVIKMKLSQRWLWPWLVLGVLLPLALALGDDERFVIDAKTDIHAIFQCSVMPRPIGSFNEFYVGCKFHVDTLSSIRSLELHSVTIDGSKLAPVDGFHTELSFSLEPKNNASILMADSRIQSSAVEMQAHRIELDAHSSIDVSGRGLKFGPGYNSWLDTGGSYGGMGGASLSSADGHCDKVPPNSFFRAIGDVSGDLSNFRGYGSGGGSDTSRGGGRIQLTAAESIEINGTVLANGGDACSDCFDADNGGSGGTVLLSAGARLHGSARVEANGGSPSIFQSDKSHGGGGGGGGGRIVLSAMKADGLAPANVTAFGGGFAPMENAAIQWCQLGGDGTILKLQQSATDEDGRDPPKTVGQLLVKGDRLDHSGPVKRIQIYGCTPIYEITAREQPFVPPSVAHVFVSGGATVCTSYIRLKPTVSGVNSSIVIDSGAELNGLDRDRSIHLTASTLSLQGFIGPASQDERDAVDFQLDSVDLSLANALLLVRTLDAHASGSFTMDKYSVVKFDTRVTVQAGSSITVNGFLEPKDDSRFSTSTSKLDILTRPDEKEPTIELTADQNITLTPQTSSPVGAVAVRVKAGDAALVDLPFDAPYLKLSVVAKNVTLVHVNAGAIAKCEAIDHQAQSTTCATLNPSSLRSMESHSPYLVSVFASEVATIGNITAGAVLLCSDDGIVIEGSVSSNTLGCNVKTGLGPGKSEMFGDASGGAGHGGRGGNVQPDNKGAGVAYDSKSDIESLYEHHAWPIWPGSAAASGDSSDAVVGGNGGGVLYLHSKSLELKTTGMIGARGGDGSKRGGGGSGGSMTLHISELRGGGLIDISGGAVKTSSASAVSLESNRSAVWKELDSLSNLVQASTTGGGGSGGVIRIVYHEVNGSANNGEQFIKDGGLLSMDGGVSNGGGESGQPGVSVGANCSPGRGGVFCLQCPEGDYSPGNFSKCSPCEPGSCSDHMGSPKCDPCSPGSFTSEFGQHVCLPCLVGTFTDVSGSKHCKACPPGKFAGSTGSNECALCPVGSIATTAGSSNCTLCGIGETTQAAGAIKCLTCYEKPVHSIFNMRGNCSYACEKGRNGLDCLTPFERLVKPIGGPLGFVLMVFTLTGAIFGTWGLISYRSSQHKKHRYTEYKAQTLRDQLSLAKLTRDLTPRLTDQDLEAHVARLYITGDNHLESSWTLQKTFLPLTLRDIVYEGAFAQFADQCNEILRWNPRGWEAVLQRALLCLLPPLSTLFMRTRQLKRVVNLANFVTQYRGGFFRDINVRVHGAQIKIGFSPDFSLAYLDVLVSPGSGGLGSLSQSGTGSVDRMSGNQISTLVVAGSGSFFRPYHLDTNDTFVRSVPSRFQLLNHGFWIEFVAEVNELLRILPQPSSSTRIADAMVVIQDVLGLIALFNKRHAERDGITLAFGIFAIDTGAETNEACFSAWTENSEEILETLGQYTVEPFKLAFQVIKTGPGRGSPRTASWASDREFPTTESIAGNSDISPVEGGRATTKLESDPRPADFRFSQIRMEALFSHSSSMSPRGLGNRTLSSDRAALLAPPSPTKAKVRNGFDRRREDLAKLVCSSRLASMLLKVLQPISPLFRLRNTRAIKAKRPLWVFSLGMLVLLILDFAVVFWVLMEYYCVQVSDPTASDDGCSRAAFWSVNGILPAAMIGAPVLGVIFLLWKSVFYGKLFALWNVSSIVNLVVAFICGLVYRAYLHETVLGVCVLGVALKYAEKRMAAQCMAQYVNERQLRGWRGLHTTKDWYDSAYTPLVFHES